MTSVHAVSAHLRHIGRLSHVRRSLQLHGAAKGGLARHSHVADAGACCGPCLRGRRDAPYQRLGLRAADFGLSRNMDVQTRVETRTYGTITHMAPEVLRANIVSRAADVYSFGVILWELAAGCRAWVGAPPPGSPDSLSCSSL